MDIKYYIQVWLIRWILVLITAKACYSISLSSACDQVDSCNSCPDLGDSSISPIFSCPPCSQISLLSLLLDKHGTYNDSDFQATLAREFGSHESCGKLLHNMTNTFMLLVLKRYLVGEGSHRHLVSSLRFDIPSDGIPWLDDYFCEPVLVESLPTGVFADSFELQHFVHRGVFIDAAVFGDKNLELPSSLSKRSMVKLHLKMGHGSILELQDGLQTELPLHARYPPLDASGYTKVEINPPDFLMLCKPKLLQHDCSSVVINWNARCAEKVVWNVPSGNRAFSRIVSAVTFASALVSALVIVYTALFCSLFSKDMIN